MGGAVLSLEQAERRLRASLPARDPGLSGDQAAVAAVLREGERGLEVLLMRRAEHPQDPWSGHVSLPGGRREPGDASLVETAIRETREEVGLELAGAPLLGALTPLKSKSPRGFRMLTIAPFVFAHAGDFQPVLSGEVVRAFWLPLEPVMRGELDGEIEWRALGLPLKMPAWKHDGETVWGLTHRILGGLLARLTPPA